MSRFIFSLIITTAHCIIIHSCYFCIKAVSENIAHKLKILARINKIYSWIVGYWLMKLNINFFMKFYDFKKIKSWSLKANFEDETNHWNEIKWVIQGTFENFENSRFLNFLFNIHNEIYSCVNKNYEYSEII